VLKRARVLLLAIGDPMLSRELSARAPRPRILAGDDSLGDVTPEGRMSSIAVDVEYQPRDRDAVECVAAAAGADDASDDRVSLATVADVDDLALVEQVQDAADLDA
jgi:hypothetical protein